MQCVYENLHRQDSAAGKQQGSFNPAICGLKKCCLTQNGREAHTLILSHTPSLNNTHFD